MLCAQNYVIFAQKLPEFLSVEHSAPSSNNKYCGTFGKLPAVQSHTSAIKRRPYDVIGYSLYLDWRDVLSRVESTGAAREFSGINTIRIRIDSADVRSIDLDAASMTIDSVYVKDVQVLPNPYQINDVLTIPLGFTAQAGEIFNIEIFYTHITRLYPNHFDPNNRGFYLYPKGYSDLNLTNGDVVEERLAYTLGAPDDARYWMPCNDAPYDKAIFDIHVTVPDSFTVAANGLLRTKTLNSDSSWTFHWGDTSQIATYLMVAHASKYKEFSDWYVRPNGDSVEIQNYCWEKDYDTPGWNYNAKNALKNTSAMIKLFSQEYGEFPFAKYGQAIAQPFLYGGMENQTMTTLTRFYIDGNQESTVAHELMHEWMGDKTTPATWNDIWLNEGGATYGEALWAEQASGFAGYQATMDAKRTRYLYNNNAGTSQPPCYRAAVFPIDIYVLYNYAITYCKGGWVYHSLRKMLGDDAYFASMKNFLNRNAYKSVETEQLVSSFEKDNPNSIIPIRTFFEQWVYGQGHPIYQMSVNVASNSTQFQADVTLTQTQTTQNCFKMPVKITFVGSNGERDVRTLLDTQRIQTGTFTLAFLPKQAILDENSEILCVKTTSLVGVEEAEPTHVNSLEIFPNPAVSDSDIRLRFSIKQVGLAKIDVWDCLGRHTTSLHNGLLPEGTYSLKWETGELPAGTYIVRATLGESTFIQKIILQK